MVISLSKLAYKSTLLISEQVHDPFIYGDALCVLHRGFHLGHCFSASLNIAKRLLLDALDCPLQLLSRPKSDRLTVFCLDFKVCSLRLCIFFKSLIWCNMEFKREIGISGIVMVVMVKIKDHDLYLSRRCDWTLCHLFFFIKVDSWQCIINLTIWMQVNFLLLLLNREKALRTRATALRCLHLTFMKGMGQSLISATVFKALLSIIEEAELPSTIQCEALQLLHKLVSPELLYWPFHLVALYLWLNWLT